MHPPLQSRHLPALASSAEAESPATSWGARRCGLRRLRRSTLGVTGFSPLHKCGNVPRHQCCGCLSTE
eukprot:3013208-Prymnesium_polylepis.1